MAALKIIIALCILQCLQIEAILNRGHRHYLYEMVPTPKQKRLIANTEPGHYTRGTHLQEPGEPQRGIVKDLSKVDNGYTISRNINKASDKGLTVLEVNFIKNNYYLNNLTDNKSDEKSNSVNKKLDKEVRDYERGQTKIKTRGSDTMLKVVNFGTNVNNSEHVLDKIVFPDTNITSFLNSHEHRGESYKKNGEHTNLRTKPFNTENPDKNKKIKENLTLDSTQNTTDIPIPITNAPVVQPKNKDRDESDKKFVLIPVMPAGNGDGMFQEGKPITFYPVSIDKIKQYARDNTDKDAEVPPATNSRNVNVQDIKEKANNNYQSCASISTKSSLH